MRGTEHDVDQLPRALSKPFYVTLRDCIAS